MLSYISRVLKHLHKVNFVQDCRVNDPYLVQSSSFRSSVRRYEFSNEFSKLGSRFLASPCKHVSP